MFKAYSMYELKENKHFSGRPGPLLLIILDGIGITDKKKGNAYYLAKPETLPAIKKECIKKELYCELQASGPAVGLLREKDMGNSEVGHNALGAGQIYNQGAKLVDEALKSGKIFQTETWKEIESYVKKHKSTVHLLGLLSNGNVHSNYSQLIMLIDGLVDTGIPNVRIHILTDGRDVPAKSALQWVEPLQEKLKDIREKHAEDNFNYYIASGGGRMYVTMDRYESDWKIVQRGWNAHVRGIVKEAELKNGYKGYYNSAKE
ncbi:MAG: 2,3-bisphosphoglycerate-independent phosphoglycerate mutase, partial [Asgard group archaeon]|nr:2,3-bisphosphoglycerate-independent phosphoglycerate mutase [Asgard group archaeon]